MAGSAAGVAVAALCRLLGVAAKSTAASFALAWPVMYLVPILGAALALTVLWRGIPQSRHPAPAAEAQPDAETATGAETR